MTSNSRRSIVLVVASLLLVFMSACTPNEDSNSTESEDGKQELRQKNSEGDNDDNKVENQQNRDDDKSEQKGNSQSDNDEDNDKEDKD